MSEYKILFTGTMGAGKTTAIAAISEIPPVTTDVQNNDPTLHKEKTTVGLDYGELTLPGGEQLRLYGTPGQQRFSFMWQILAKGALGLVILLDHSRPDPVADLSIYLTNFAELIARTGCVVAVGRLDPQAYGELDSYAKCLADHGVICPVLSADVRDKNQVLALLDLLLLQLEHQVAQA
ncbi:GTP-binding protein [Pseudomonas sp. TTU2014-080ASC]|uniref:GTP-binding protein n=1 Tax=Pseudomonas sp. TTU2014-080ASC TaxID=1729724 RepID=UPI0007189569|nr:ATP/GTP-binding protein [Pseudomonas sp. TTU2014-080ASC]KRW57525.1 GTP-binding protein [Pseudomonas sp. TTU2014-080ASC]